MNLSDGQRLMIEDGLPVAAIIDQATRAELWKGRPLIVPSPFVKTTIVAMDSTTRLLCAELEAAAAKKKAASLQRLKDWKLFNDRSLPKPELKPRVIAPNPKENEMAKKATATNAAPKAAKVKKAASASERARYDWKGAEAKAANGLLPSKPDFSAPTHARFFPIMEKISKACSDKDAKALKAIEIIPASSTPKAMARYRDLCVKALSAKAA